jgi:membrane protease YdiL (CAAX protease family)
MQYELFWKQSDLVPFLSITASAFFFCAYWFIFVSKNIEKYFYENFSGDKGRVYHVLFTKYTGFLLMGVIPCIFSLAIMPQYTLSDYGISFSKGTNHISFYWIAGLSPIIIIMNWFSARRPEVFSMYPQIRVKEWNAKLIIHYSLSWCAYLFGYEFLFRGLLLIPLADTIGVWPAIAVNIALYSATHISNGKSETIGAAPLGLVLCLLTLQTGTIWIAFGVHVVLALSSNLLALKFNPEMKIVKISKQKINKHQPIK